MVERDLGFHSEAVLVGRGVMGNSGYLENQSSFFLESTIPSGCTFWEQVPCAHFFWGTQAHPETLPGRHRHSSSCASTSCGLEQSSAPDGISWDTSAGREELSTLHVGMVKDEKQLPASHTQVPKTSSEMWPSCISPNCCNTREDQVPSVPS